MTRAEAEKGHRVWQQPRLEGEGRAVTLWMSFGLNESPEVEAGTGTMVLLSEHNLDAGLSLARSGLRARGWRALCEQNLPGTKAGGRNLASAPGPQRPGR